MIEKGETGDQLEIVIDGRPQRVAPGMTVAVAVLAAGISGWRRSVTGGLRGPLCGMGICYECRLTIDGVAQSRSCQILCRDGMEVRTDG